MSRSRFMALLLALAALAVYLPAVQNGFILYDDGDYVTQNQMVQDGLTLAGTKWAFTTFKAANWHPLTWLSLMLDCELFGVNPAGSHFINALFHVANTVLVFVLWLQLTRRKTEPRADDSESDAFWPAAFIAALFALHPLHVESVAWVAERKDVLSAFFGLLALLCYGRFVTHDGCRFSVSYWLALVFFACGLMCKPMLVTLPFVMLLLDYWPLGRFSALTMERCAGKASCAQTNGRLEAAPTGRQDACPTVRLVLEKIPFFLLTAASCIVTWFAQNTGAVRTLGEVPLAYRLENAPVAVATYLLKLIWPARLAVIYPMPNSIPPAALAASLVVLVFLTVAVWLARKQNPFLLVGWLWFLGMLVPVLGLVKVGEAALADRYTYLPSIGIFMAVAFGAQAFARRFAPPKFLLPAIAALMLAALALVTERQLQFWRDDETLFKHATDVTTDNMEAMINYGVALEYDGKPVAAMAQYRRVRDLAPSVSLASVGRVQLLYSSEDLGDLLYHAGKLNEALEQYQAAARLGPISPSLHDRLGIVLDTLKRFSEATNEYYEALRIAPDDLTAHLDLGIALAGHDDFAGATNEFSQAMRLDPGNPMPLVEWAKALLHQGRNTEAMDKLNQAMQLAPDIYQTLAFTAHVLASDDDANVRDGSRALALAQKADELTEGLQPLVKDALGMAYAETGQFDEAQQAANDAIRLATAAGMKPETIAAMQERLALYEKHQPWRESFELPAAKK